MVDKSFNLTFKTNLKEVAKQQERVTELFGEQLAMASRMDGMAKSRLGDLFAQQKAWSNVRSNASLTNNELAFIDKNVKSISSQTKEIQPAFESLLAAVTPFGKSLVFQNRRITELVLNMRKVQEAGPFLDVLSDYTKNFSNNLGILRGGMTKVFGGGMKGFITNIGVGIKALIPLASSLLATLAPFLPIILGVIAVIFVLQRMWANNVGGMQTRWHKFVASMRDTWLKFVAQFDSILRDLGPVFDLIFDGLGRVFFPLKIAFKLISFNLKGIMFWLKPIAKLLGFLARVIKVVFDAFIVKKFIEGLEVVKNVLQPITDFLTTIWEKIQAIFDNPLVKKFVGDINEAVSNLERSALPKGAISGMMAQPVMASQMTSNISRSVNNNSSVVINSGGAISPENAPRIGDMISSSITTGSRVI